MSFDNEQSPQWTDEGQGGAKLPPFVTMSQLDLYPLLDLPTAALEEKNTLEYDDDKESQRREEETSEHQDEEEAQRRGYDGQEHLGQEDVKSDDDEDDEDEEIEMPVSLAHLF